MNRTDRNYVANERGISYFGAFLSIVMGYAVQNALFTCSDVSNKDVPVLVIVVLWFIFSTMIMVAMDKLGV